MPKLNLLNETAVDLYIYLCEYAAAYGGLSPTYREIVRELDCISSTGHLYDRLTLLEAAGLIRRVGARGKRRGIMIVGSEWKAPEAYFVLTQRD